MFSFIKAQQPIDHTNLYFVTSQEIFKDRKYLIPLKSYAIAYLLNFVYSAKTRKWKLEMKQKTIFISHGTSMHYKFSKLITTVEKKAT